MTDTDGIYYWHHELSHSRRKNDVLTNILCNVDLFQRTEGEAKFPIRTMIIHSFQQY